MSTATPATPLPEENPTPNPTPTPVPQLDHTGIVIGQSCLEHMHFHPLKTPKTPTDKPCQQCGVVHLEELKVCTAHTLYVRCEENEHAVDHLGVPWRPEHVGSACDRCGSTLTDICGGTVFQSITV